MWSSLDVYVPIFYFKTLKETLPTVCAWFSIPSSYCIVCFSCLFVIMLLFLSTSASSILWSLDQSILFAHVRSSYCLFCLSFNNSSQMSVAFAFCLAKICPTLSACRSVCLSTLSACRSVCLSLCLRAALSACRSVSLSSSIFHRLSLPRLLLLQLFS